MERKIYLSDEVLSLSEYIASEDDSDCYHCWQDEETQSGYNHKLACSFEEWTEDTSVKPRFIATIKRLSDKAGIGAIFLSSEDTPPDLAIMIYKPYRGKGYGKRAFLLGIKYCFEVLSLDYIYAGCYPHNIASMKMLQKCGFQPHPEGNQNEKHYLTGEDIMQLDFVKYKRPTEDKTPFHFTAGDISDNGFWQALDKLAAESEIVIDRPKGSAHSRYPDFIYPLDYGYLKNTAAMDGGGIDVWRGSETGGRLDAILCIVDLMKRDSEIKLLIGCTEDEKARVYQVHNKTEFMKGILIRRQL